MDFGFLFWLFLVSIIVASVQDLKRREVDDWLNLFLIFSGLAYVFLGAFFLEDVNVIFHFGFLLAIMFAIVNVFYYGRVFAGGDAKLLFALTPFFLGATFVDSVSNAGFFLLCLMIGGSVYGLGYSGFLWSRNWNKVNVEMERVARKFGIWNLALGIGVGFLLLVFGLAKGNVLFGFFGGCLIALPFLLVFAKGLENVSMIRKIKGSELREGDWLVYDVKVGGKIVKANWEGLSLEDIELLKGKSKVMVKDGLPFVPAFLIAFIGYVFLKGWVFGMFG